MQNCKRHCSYRREHGGECFETVLDEDRLDTYKLMALRVRLVG